MKLVEFSKHGYGTSVMLNITLLISIEKNGPNSCKIQMSDGNHYYVCGTLSEVTTKLNK